jgi:hypothetical protein
MPTIPSPTAPALAAPGAGLPRFELVIARLLFRWKRSQATNESTTALIRDERRRIGALVETCPAALRSERVLIPRPRGLEDSSRFWSVLMTLDHLRIVNGSVVVAVNELVAGRVPSRTASTAAVKPSPDVTDSVVVAFESSCDALLAAGANAATLHTPSRYRHPWFGPLDAFGWKFMGAYHLGLHRGQLATIIALLPK